MSITRLEAALDYARRGWYVFPCHWVADGRCSCNDPECGSNAGKHPLGKLVPSGWKNATTDAATITGWWRQAPFANIGIATGPSDLLVLDTDPRHGGDESLLDWTGEISQDDLARTTYAVRTAGGGYHAYFKRDGAVIASGKVRPGIDIIAGTGYVIAAGSVTSAAYACVNDVEPAPVPAWVLDEVPRTSERAKARSDDEPSWVASALQGVPEGQRDDTCTRLAGYLLGKGMPADAVILLLLDFGDKCEPQFPAHEVRKVVDSIARAETAKETADVVEISETLPVFKMRVSKQPSRRMLIENLIPEGTTLFHGQPRAGKSLTIEELLIAITTGTPAFGIDALGRVAPAPVWYITEEDPESEVLARFSGLLRGRGITNLPDTLHLSVRKGLTLDDQDCRSRIVSAVKRCGIKVVVFEPLRTLTACADQGPAEFGPVAEFLRRLMRETGCSVWLGHHDIKPAATGRESRELPQRASGGGIFAFSDSPIHLERLADHPFTAAVTPTNYKFFANPLAFRFSLDISETGEYRLRGTQTTGTMTGTDNVRSEILQALSSRTHVSGSAIVTTIRRKKQDVLRELRAMQQAGILAQERSGKAGLWTIVNK